jgi:hypothetical protein
MTNKSMILGTLETRNISILMLKQPYQLQSLVVTPKVIDLNRFEKEHCAQRKRRPPDHWISDSHEAVAGKYI